MDIKTLGVKAVSAFKKVRNAMTGKALPFVKLHKIAFSVIAAATVMVMLMSMVMFKRNNVKVYVDGVLTGETVTLESDSALWPELAGVTVNAIDTVEVIDTDVYIKRGFYVSIEADNETVTLTMTKGTVADALKLADITVNDGDIVSEPLDTVLTENASVTVSRVKSEKVTETETVEYKTKKVKTDKLYEGQTEVETEGENGKIKYTYKVTYTDGKETERELIKKETVKEAVDKVILVGTKVKSSFVKTSSTPKSYKAVYTMKASAYTYGEDGGNYTATGVKCRRGIVAVDPDVIPLGTKLYIESTDGRYIYGEAVAGDTGSAIKGNKIDIFVESRSECYNFGRRNVNVYIIG